MLHFSKIKLFLIFVILKSTNAKICQDVVPNIAEDCYKQGQLDSDSAYCCYLRRTDFNTSNTDKICQNFIDSGDSLFPPKNLTINETKYSVICNYTTNDEVDPFSAGQKCSQGSPTNSTECTKFSFTNNKCCYYKNSLTKITTCFWLGEYTNYDYSFNTINTTIITCSSTTYLNLSFYICIYFYIMLLLN